MKQAMLPEGYPKGVIGYILLPRVIRNQGFYSGMHDYKKTLLTLVFLAFGLSGAPAYAQTDNSASSPAQEQTQEAQKDEHYVTFRVLAEKNTIKAGEEIWIGVEQSIAPEWHTYWLNPGDSGSAPKHNWKLPAGFEIGDIQWPAPEKIPYPPLLNYGYSERVLLLQKLTAPQELPDGPISLTVDAETLVCKDVCIPEYGTFTLTLNDQDAPEEDNSAYFAQTIEQWPQIVDWAAEFSALNGNFILNIETPEGFKDDIEESSLQFIPADWGVVENAAPAETGFQDNIIVITQKLGERPAADIKDVSGILIYADKQGAHKAISFGAQSLPALADNAAGASGADRAATSPSTTNGELGRVAQTGFLTALVLAILGGLVLNLMPCVFPVLSLKALSLVKMSEKDHGLARMHGIAYTLGVILSFMAVAGALIALQAGGAQIGWGFQLQNPIIIALLAYLLFVIGLNLSGFFEFSGGLSNVGNNLTRKEGLQGSFFTGVLATIVATPCTAPFMSVAIGYALLQPAIISLSIFAALGFGLALPYLLLAFIPALQKRLPRPGAWMDVFRQFLAFPMFAFAAWLVWILAQQSGSFGVLGALLGMICLAFAIWLIKVRPAKGSWRKIATTLAVIAALASLAVLPGKSSGTNQSAVHSTANGKDFGESFSRDKLNEALSGDTPVFVEMTAAWCITCKVNHATSINIDSTKKVFADNNVTFLIGDWTNRDPVITEYLSEFGRNGVPIYVVYGKPDSNGQRPEPKVLPQILTPGIVAGAIAGN